MTFKYRRHIFDSGVTLRYAHGKYCVVRSVYCVCTHAHIKFRVIYCNKNRFLSSNTPCVEKEFLNIWQSAESYIPILYIIIYQSKMLILKHLKTFQHVSIFIQIISRGFVGSLLKSLNLKFKNSKRQMWGCGSITFGVSA